LSALGCGVVRLGLLGPFETKSLVSAHNCAEFVLTVIDGIVGVIEEAQLADAVGSLDGGVLIGDDWAVHDEVVFGSCGSNKESECG